MSKKKKMQGVTEAGWGPDLKRLYGIRDEARVFSFLTRHPFLIDLLKEAYLMIQEHFPGSSAIIELRTATPGSGDTELVVLVATNLNPVDAFKQRQHFDSDWWRALLPRTKGKLQIRMEFQKGEDAAPWLKPTAGALDSLLALPPNWDSYGARPVDAACAAYALEVLHSVMSEDTPAPQVVPTPAGGIQLEWHTRGVDLEIEIGTPDCGHVLYENLKTRAEWEGEIPADLTPVRQFIADLSR